MGIEGEYLPGSRTAGGAAALSGVAASAVASAAASILLPGMPYPVVVVADRLATLTPGVVATFFIDLLRHLALPLTVVVTAAGLMLVSWLAGRYLLTALARRLGIRPAAALVAAPLWATGVLAFRPDVTTVGRPVFGLVLAACAAIGVAVTAGTFRRLTERDSEDPERGAERTPDISRRSAVRAIGVGTAGVALGWVAAGSLFRRENPGTKPLGKPPATPARVAAEAPAFRDIEGLSPRITPLGDFYVVDEEVVDPDVDASEWRLSVEGHVDSPLALSYEELLEYPLVEQFATLECISNPVGGDLISTTKWTGVRLADLLQTAQVGDGAVEVVFRAISGYSDSLPLADALRPVTLIAVGMDGMTLPREHGYPARLLAPGYYGMKQPKWLRSIEVVTEPYQGYWEQRGWIKAAIVKTWSRIDTVDDAQPQRVVAGVAFAGDRGVAAVEVSLDGGSTWQPAEMEPPASDFTWRRWKLAIPPEAAGSVMVRATDGLGEVQVAEAMEPHPSGATGLDTANL